ncbi:PAS domain S-box-containing protein/diguanylate cyclase (GGDEF) domain-containing protein [Kaistia soli DSM 19436]|uniref:PAS domain S-box-containing protein/diguanylate cyclase (GGDEF) domain-containing protein n=1 Tax=Kaistia soli DSM 19436 TaxID=1122133 RepID=A0A1M5LCF5_9HYPH|nr:sensor domain-containing diguanylate cyclase [Kaistia soli]SHG62656.1 PAS domain S-box-containing protein/diguanylate cyclase (GGDEF) domain-containing protein [Kaistia soli DSM 19436]
MNTAEWATRQAGALKAEGEAEKASSEIDCFYDTLCHMARRLFGVGAVAVRPGVEDSCRVGLAEHIDAAAAAPAIRSAMALLSAADEAVEPSNSREAGSLSLIASSTFGDDGRLALFDAARGRLDIEERQHLQDLARLAEGLWRLERRAREAALQGEHFRLLADTSTDTIIRGNLDGIRLYVSPAIRELLGYEPEELVGRRAIDITHADDVPTFGRLMGKVRAGDLDVGRVEQRMLHKDGSWCWIEAHIRLTQDKRTGEPDGYVVSVRGIDERKAIEARLELLANRDELTGLPNRKLFRERLLAGLSKVGSGERRFALWWIDIDRFKDINDSLGHQAGDAVLREAALRFEAVARPGDIVARLGGDEFALIGAVGPDDAEAAALAEQLIEAMRVPVAAGDHTIEVGLSIGIACAPDCGLDPDELLAAADKALYQAKSAGRRTYRFCQKLAAR